MSPPLHPINHLPQPPQMYPRIIRQLRVEARGKDITLPDSNDVLLIAPRHGPQHLDAIPIAGGIARQYGLDDGCPDEDARKRSRRRRIITLAP